MLTELSILKTNVPIMLQSQMPVFVVVVHQMTTPMVIQHRIALTSVQQIQTKSLQAFVDVECKTSIVTVMVCSIATTNVQVFETISSQSITTHQFPPSVAVLTLVWTTITIPASMLLMVALTMNTRRSQAFAGVAD
jgi:hypothetical protein